MFKNRIENMCKVNNCFFGRHLATSAMIRSNPGDLLRGYLLIVYFTSFRVLCLTGRQTGSGALKNSSIEFIL